MEDVEISDSEKTLRRNVTDTLHSQRLSDTKGTNLIPYFVTREEQQVLTQYRIIFLNIQLGKNRTKKL